MIKFKKAQNTINGWRSNEKIKKLVKNKHLTSKN